LAYLLIMSKYTPEILESIKHAYLASPKPETVRALSDQYGIGSRSIIAKLATLGIYKRATYRTKSGEAPILKSVYADRLGDLLGLDDFEVEQLEKLSKALLKKMISKIEN
jgi:hypothetical protein